MTQLDYQLEHFFKEVGARPQRKYEDTNTWFDRDVFWYDRDELSRQVDATKSGNKITYEDHRKAAETAVNIYKAETPHDIAMTILTHRFFAQYRADVFEGEGSFTTDYSFIITKVATLYNTSKGGISTTTISSRLNSYTTPTLVQINHIAGTVTDVILPESAITLNDWAIKLNAGAPESTSYRVAGMKVGI